MPCRDLGAAASNAVVNPFYSENLQREMALEASRPRHLPAAGDEGSEVDGQAPLMHEGRRDSGKGHGGDVAGLFHPTGRPTVYGPQPSVKQSQGVMPEEPPKAVQQTMGSILPISTNNDNNVRVISHD